MQAVKIVITGAYSAGKTNFIRSISDIDPVSTEYEVTDAQERELKHHTTVALDFGKIEISDEVVLYLFGTPGQSRFDFMWEVLSEGCVGYVVMVDSCRPAHFVETQHLLARFATITDAPFVVAANKQDDPTALPISYIRRRLQLPFEIPVLPCVATERESVKNVLLTLLDHIDRSIPEEAIDPPTKPTMDGMIL
ncbi:GTP-binding protein [Kouleothrix aurantiaca]|uniref:GTP-binding protein n=1 Tax=Kouleothrix aurantiaca TaxID=186479 RepID=A0A0N8PT42_9CHLR|nr:GTP-binding protein [Kouleothrix aurantiaca]